MDLFSTTRLLGVINSMQDDAPRRFMFDRYFAPRPVYFQTKEIAFDKIPSTRRVAPYVSHRVQGRAQALPTRAAMTFTPTYVKPKAPITPDAVVLGRVPGEALGGGQIPLQQRLNQVVVSTLEDHEKQIRRREEMQAIEIMRTGKLIAESPEYPRNEIDFGRNVLNTVALTSGDRWGEANVIPMDDLTEWATAVHRRSGAFPFDVIMDPLAAGLFTKDAELRKILDIRRQRSGDFELVGTVSGNDGVYLGSIGQFNFWQYQQTYDDDNGSSAQMIPDYSVFLASDGVEGFATYGAIMDLENLRAVPRWPKNWLEQDPSVMMLMTQSAPLPVVARPNASFYATVR